MTKIPPKKIPEELLKDYNMYGEISVLEWYFNNTTINNPIWSNDLIDTFIKKFNPNKIINDEIGYEDYKNGALYILFACCKYTEHIKNKNVAVIGSLMPWIEAILINYGAKTITTIEYNKPECNHDIIRTITYDEFCKSDDKYDAIFSYSSIEHSGLGRYGDELDPYGDIETMLYMHRSLKKNGLIFLGVPIGKDAIVWNAHRIYGEKRLQILLLPDKLKELEWIGVDKKYIYECELSATNIIQPIIVLQNKRKINNVINRYLD